MLDCVSAVASTANASSCSPASPLTKGTPAISAASATWCSCHTLCGASSARPPSSARAPRRAATPGSPPTAATAQAATAACCEDTSPCSSLPASAWMMRGSSTPLEARPQASADSAKEIAPSAAVPPPPAPARGSARAASPPILAASPAVAATPLLGVAPPAASRGPSSCRAACCTTSRTDWSRSWTVAMAHTVLASSWAPHSAACAATPATAAASPGLELVQRMEARLQARLASDWGGQRRCACGPAPGAAVPCPGRRSRSLATPTAISVFWWSLAPGRWFLAWGGPARATAFSRAAKKPGDST
mmetsp:Transcript_62744/g.144475  ORF Transcript_62744/g.144475 Transcript_62744/m.144475 type:complete len:305 (-) Transcript_62744:519-1433(-)